VIKAYRNRILVKMLPVTADFQNSLDLVLVDGKKHFDHKSRRGVVESVGKFVRLVKAGDEVLFRGDAGYSLDYDPDSKVNLDEHSYRWLKEADCLAVLEPESKAMQEVA